MLNQEHKAKYIFLPFKASTEPQNTRLMGKNVYETVGLEDFDGGDVAALSSSSTLPRDTLHKILKRLELGDSDLKRVSDHERMCNATTQMSDNFMDQISILLFKDSAHFIVLPTLAIRKFLENPITPAKGKKRPPEMMVLKDVNTAKDYDMILVPVLDDRIDHWTLCAIFPGQGLIVPVDSKHGTSTTITEFASKLSGIHQVQQPYEVMNHSLLRQGDGWSCGYMTLVHMVLFAKAFKAGKAEIRLASREKLKDLIRDQFAFPKLESKHIDFVKRVFRDILRKIAHSQEQQEAEKPSTTAGPTLRSRSKSVSRSESGSESGSENLHAKSPRSRPASRPASKPASRLGSLSRSLPVPDLSETSAGIRHVKNDDDDEESLESGSSSSSASLCEPEVCDKVRAFFSCDAIKPLKGDDFAPVYRTLDEAILFVLKTWLLTRGIPVKRVDVKSKTMTRVSSIQRSQAILRAISELEARDVNCIVFKANGRKRIKQTQDEKEGGDEGDEKGEMLLQYSILSAEREKETYPNAAFLVVCASDDETLWKPILFRYGERDVLRPVLDLFDLTFERKQTRSSTSTTSLTLQRIMSGKQQTTFIYKTNTTDLRAKIQQLWSTFRPHDLLITEPVT